MALINCPECNKEVSDKAEICPNCGFGVAKYVERQNRIVRIQQEAEKEAYLYVKQKKKEEEEKAEREKHAEENRKNSIYAEAVNKYTSESSKDVERAEELFLAISGWKDSDTYLIKCKDRTSELRKCEALREEKHKKRNKKIIFVTVIIGICVGFIIGGYSFYKMIIVPRNIYESARLSIKNGDYEEAIEKLETIIDYKDTEQQIEIASEGIYERDYANVKRLVAEQKYSEALEILKNMENRDDVDELMTLCENALKYQEAVELAEIEKYREAISILEDIEDFKDSANILVEYRLEADYLDAVNYADNGDYKKAIHLFENLGDYKDAKEKSVELCYQFGIREFENKNYANAKEYLEKISDSKDVIAILNECELQLSYADLYSAAQTSIEANNLYDALSYLKQLPSDYKDTADKIELCDKYKNVVGEWRCVGYDGADNKWITDEKACRRQDFTVKVDDNGNLSLVDYKFDYSELEYTGTTLSWFAVGSITEFNVSTGIMTYDGWGGPYKQAYIRLAK